MTKQQQPHTQENQAHQPIQPIQLTLDGRKRKAAADCIGTVLGVMPVYQCAPTYAYTIGSDGQGEDENANDEQDKDGGGSSDCVKIDRNGVLSFAENTSTATVHTVLLVLHSAGFITETAEDMEKAGVLASQNEPDRLTISMPLTGFTPEKLDNLRKLVASKQSLLQKVIDTDALPVVYSKDTLDFPWFNVNAMPEEVAAYTQLVSALCEMAKKQTRILATDKVVDNEKYAFRCFLLRLGFIGENYATTRRILLQNLSGNGSFKNGARKACEVLTEDELANAGNSDAAKRKPSGKPKGSAQVKQDKATEQVSALALAFAPVCSIEPLPERSSEGTEPERKRFSLRKLFGALKVMALD
jgi:hypothetical protein